MLEVGLISYREPSRLAADTSLAAAHSCLKDTHGHPRVRSGRLAFLGSSSFSGISRSAPATQRGSKHNPFGINSYKIVELKLPLESTLTEKIGGGSLGTSLRVAARDRSTLLESYSCIKKQNNSIRMIFLQKNRGGTPTLK
jgi:hypothetical protein